jgi:predicted nucleotidyltransferase
MSKKTTKLPSVQNRADIIRRLTKHNKEIQSFKVTRLELFGSAARDELHKRSDMFKRISMPSRRSPRFYFDDILRDLQQYSR